MKAVGHEQNTAREEILTGQRQSSDVIYKANIKFCFLLYRKYW